MTAKLKGLTEAEVQRSRAEHGSNSFARIKTKGFLGKFIENLRDPIIKILLIALAIEIIFTLGHCDFLEIGGILAAILIATTVSTASECGSESAFKKMEGEASGRSARVLRDGSICELPPDQLVVGDIVFLYAGERVMADGVMLDGRICVDQSALNGEGAEVEKRVGTSAPDWQLSSPSCVFSGSVITDGSGIMRVGRVGEATYYGMVASDVQTETRKSPLKLRLSALASQISRLGYVMAALVGIAFLFNTLVADNAFSSELILADLTNARFMFDTLLHAMTMMITVIVVSTPEGLPMMITVVLCANMKRMLHDNVLVKKPVGIETAGSLNILFTDKTGTVTSGRLAVDCVVSGNGIYKTERALSKSGALWKYLCMSAAYNTDTVRVDGRVSGGNATDRAIAEFFASAKCSGESVVAKMPFKSENKYSTVTLSSGLTLYKGAAEVIIDKCAYALSQSGEALASDLAYERAEYQRRTAIGERVVAVALADKGADKLTLVALISLKDRIRKGASRAIQDIQRAGIQVVMITGDGKETAAAIAEEAGILTSRTAHAVITSRELSEMSDEEIARILPEMRVVARALPRDKMRLVRISQGLDLVAGMTGDGINDAPSLKLADVGFAMGSGTDIAKSASDIVILDDSLCAIAKTVLYGRTIFKSIRKFITFQLVMNLAACGVSLVGQFIGIDTPITVIQMLWVNIIMDTLGGLAFAGEPPLDYYMKERPKRRDEPILSGSMLSHIAFTGGYTVILSVFFLCSGYFRSMFSFDISADKFYTAFYALFIFSGIMNCLCARCERIYLFSSIGKNKAFLGIMLIISVIQILMIYFGGTVFRSVPLSARELFTVIALASTVIPFDTLRRIIYKLS